MYRSGTRTTESALHGGYAKHGKHALHGKPGKQGTCGGLRGACGADGLVCWEQNTNQNAALEFTDENTKAGNALWEYIVDVLGTGNLMYKETNPKKATTFSITKLLKRIRQEHGTGGVKPEPEKG